MNATKDSDDQDAIRHQAYLIWLEEGQPEGRSDEHWRLACELRSAEAREHDPSPSAQTDAAPSKSAT